MAVSHESLFQLCTQMTLSSFSENKNDLQNIVNAVNSSSEEYGFNYNHVNMSRSIRSVTKK